MRRLWPLLTLLLSACGPWCGPDPGGQAGFAEFDGAAAAYREAVLTGAPESGDAALFEVLLREAERYAAAQPDRNTAERALAERAARLISQAATTLPDPAARSAAAARALRGWRRFVLPAHPEAARYLQ